MSGENESAGTDFDPGRVIRPAGDRAMLVTAPVAEFAAALRGRAPAGVQDVLPAAETVLVTLDSVRDAEDVRRVLETILREVIAAGERPESGSALGTEEPVVIPVHYDGVDLAEVAYLLDMSAAEVVAAHTGTVWHCGFVGFAPGFGYLEAPDGRLDVPRRAQSRTAIPAGAVALAGGYSAVYPRRTPGGWQLIGHTDLPMWDTERDPPALIRAGAAVRFVAADR